MKLFLFQILTRKFQQITEKDVLLITNGHCGIHALMGPLKYLISLPTNFLSSVILVFFSIYLYLCHHTDDSVKEIICMMTVGCQILVNERSCHFRFKAITLCYDTNLRERQYWSRFTVIHICRFLKKSQSEE